METSVAAYSIPNVLPAREFELVDDGFVAFLPGPPYWNLDSYFGDFSYSPS
jgi:hypothetical protein